MALGVVATYNGSYHSPGFDLIVTGLASFNRLTIYRIDATGELPDTPVRGADDVPISGGTFAITDYEAPVGREVVYRATATAGSSSDTGASSPLGVQDNFSRTASNGWGTPDIGSPWAIRSGAVGDFAVSSGVGRMNMTQRSINGSLGTDYVISTALNHSDIEQKARVRTPLTAAGDAYRHALVARETDRDNWWELEVNFIPSGEIHIRIGREVNGAGWYTHADNGVLVPGLTHTAGAWYWMKFQVVGDQLRGKVWADGSTEPEWQIELTDNVHPSGSYIGVKSLSQAFSTNPTPEVVEWDQYTATILDSTTVIPAEHAGVAWLKSVGQPALSRRVNISRYDEHTRPGRILGEYEVLGRPNKVVITDVLSGREGTLTLATFPMGGVWESDSYWRDLETLLSFGGTLLLQTADSRLTGEDDMYLEVKGVSRSRIGPVGRQLNNLFNVDFVEVDSPASTQQALTLRNWQSVANQNSSWQDVLNEHSNWLDVLQRDL